MLFKTTEKQAKFVQDRLNYWSKVCQLDYFDIEIHHMDGPSINNEDIAAECVSKPQYRDATIYIYPKFWDEKIDDEKRSKILLHELCHIITKPYSKLVERGMRFSPVMSEEESEVNELTTSWISDIIFHCTDEK